MKNIFSKVPDIMRCKNCGWNNPETAKECEKCHSKFKNVPNSKGPNPFRPGSSSDLGKSPTVMGAVGDLSLAGSKSPKPVLKTDVNSFTEMIEGESVNCISCGYPLSDEATSCPNCGAPVMKKESAVNKDSDSAPLFKGTVLTGRNPIFESPTGYVSLSPVDGSSPVEIPDSVSEISLGISGEELSISTGNPVIQMTCDGDKWSIESLDEDTPVYIRVSGGKFSLVEGDIIVVNGKQFRFTK